jgi:hypothetical protein
MAYEIDINNPVSVSGRDLTPLPKLDISTNRKYTNSVKILMAWMLKNAKEEVKGDSYRTSLLEAIDLNNLSISDRDTMNLILFDDVEAEIKLK